MKPPAKQWPLTAAIVGTRALLSMVLRCGVTLDSLGKVTSRVSSVLNTSGYELSAFLNSSRRDEFALTGKELGIARNFGKIKTCVIHAMS